MIIIRVIFNTQSTIVIIRVVFNTQSTMIIIRVVFNTQSTMIIIRVVFNTQSTMTVISGLQERRKIDTPQFCNGFLVPFVKDRQQQQQHDRECSEFVPSRLCELRLWQKYQMRHEPTIFCSPLMKSEYDCHLSSSEPKQTTTKTGKNVARTIKGSQLRSCVKVEVAILVSPSQISLMVYVYVKQHLKKRTKKSAGR